MEYLAWKSGIHKDRKGKWKEIPGIVVESGDDPIQNEIRRRLEDIERQKALVGEGLLALFRNRRLNKEFAELKAEYWRRAGELFYEGWQRG